MYRQVRKLLEPKLVEQNVLAIILSQLNKMADPLRAEKSRRFMKTGVGEYGEDDKFVGISNPDLRSLVKSFRQATFEDCIGLLTHLYHEARMLGLLLLVDKFERGDETQREQVIAIYLRHTHCANSWDLVDCSCYKMLGRFLLNKDHSVLFTLANSSLIWDRRIAMVSTLHFIKHRQFDTTFRLVKVLLDDKHDLIHKAMGWMLKEVGKKDISALKSFLVDNYQLLPRTALRYSIEKMPKPEREQYLKGKI